MPSHRKCRGCDRREPTRPEKRAIIAGVGRAGKRKNPELRETANRFLLNKAIEELEAYIEKYRQWARQRDGPFNGQRLTRLVDNKIILESLRDNSSKSSSILVHAVLNTVRYSLYDCFDAVHSEQSEDDLVKSISALQLLSD